MKHGLLLLNIGSPDAPTISSVRRYLRVFLSDPRVIDLPVLLRLLLVYCFILPFRPRRSAEAYHAVWTPEGSPLMRYSERMCQSLQTALGPQYTVVLGMRYGKPSIQSALDALSACDRITVWPLYPQYSSAATGSYIEAVLKGIASKPIFPSMNVIRDFYKHPAYIKAQAAEIAPYIHTHDSILFSYHGLPENHLLKEGCNPVCTKACRPEGGARGCYRAQCLETTASLTHALKITEYSTSFQSRLGRTPWIKPYTDIVLVELAARGIKRLAVVCPSFVTDCLETLEEIGMRAKEQWLSLGGETFTLIPCMNDNERWIDAMKAIAMQTNHTTTANAGP